jgi:hypothetical protein
MALLKPVKSYEKSLLEVGRLVDGLGKPIDEKIRPLVAALRMYGIRTTGSCQGHSKRGLKYPWVNIDIRDAKGATRLVAAVRVKKGPWVFEARPTELRLVPRSTRGKKLSELQKEAAYLAWRLQGFAL